MKYIVDIKGEIEGDYEIIGKYEERPQGEKIIRCIDCKYYHPFKHWCDLHEDWAGGEDGFCSLAKMKGESE